MKNKIARCAVLLTASLRCPLLLAAAAAPLLVTGCGGGGGGASSPSGQNVTNADAPSSLPSGMTVTTPSGKLTITSATQYSFIGNNAADNSTGTYTYAANGTNATITLTHGSESDVATLTNFTVTNGNYTSVTVTPTGESAYTGVFGGTTVTYTALASGTNSNSSSTQTGDFVSGMVLAGSVYFVGGTGETGPMGANATLTINSINADESINVTLVTPFQTITAKLAFRGPSGDVKNQPKGPLPFRGENSDKSYVINLSYYYNKDGKNASGTTFELIKQHDLSGATISDSNSIYAVPFGTY